MRVFACFLRWNENSVNVSLFGPFEFVDFLFVHDGKILLYLTRPHEKYSRVVLNKENMSRTTYWKEMHEYLEIALTEEEGLKLLRTCDVFANVAHPYNFLDFMLTIVPLRSPDEQPLFETKKMSDVQAVILMLRECLTPGHPVLVATADLNSKNTLVSHLFETLQPVTKQMNWRELLRILP